MAMNQELERIRSYVYTIQRSIQETNVVSQTLKHDLEIVRNHRQIQDDTFDYDQVFDQCLTKTDEIQFVYETTTSIYSCSFIDIDLGRVWHV
jgi:hypothetical protein